MQSSHSVAHLDASTPRSYAADQPPASRRPERSRDRSSHRSSRTPAATSSSSEVVPAFFGLDQMFLESAYLGPKAKARHEERSASMAPPSAHQSTRQPAASRSYSAAPATDRTYERPWYETSRANPHYDVNPNMYDQQSFFYDQQPDTTTQYYDNDITALLNGSIYQQQPYSSLGEIAAASALESTYGFGQPNGAALEPAGDVHYLHLTREELMNHDCKLRLFAAGSLC